jgi:hypothetical protein
MYFEKSENVLKDRNNFFTVLLSALIAIFIPLTFNEFNPIIYSGNITGNSNISTYDFVGQLTSNRVYDITDWLVIISVGIITFLVLSYLFFEEKYIEYKKNYQTIQIKSIVEEISRMTANRPTTYRELCDMVQERTLFPSENIMRILKEKYFHIEY